MQRGLFRYDVTACETKVFSGFLLIIPPCLIVCRLGSMSEKLECLHYSVFV